MSGKKADTAPSQRVLEYWFGSEGRTEHAEYFGKRNHLWFMGGSKVDEEIRAEFAEDIERAASGKLDSWKDTSRGALALIVLLDQFALNIFRGDKRGYLYSDLALPIAKDILATGDFQAFTVAEKIFLFMPLEHSEDLKDQEESVRLYRNLAGSAPPALGATLKGTLAFAERHLKVVKEFGRFPHRNAALGRVSSAAELAFLASPRAPF